MTENIASKMRAKMQASAGHERVDLYVSDVMPVSPSVAKVLVAFHKESDISSEEVTAFMLAHYNGKLLPNSETYRVHPEGCVSMLASLHRETRPLEYAENQRMLKLSAASFMDTKMGQLWQVDTLEDGTKYLSLQSEENLEAVLTAGLPTGRPGVHRFTNITAGILHMLPGDKVKLFLNNRVQMATVKSVAEDRSTVTVECGKGIYTVPSGSVVEMVEPGAESVQATTKIIQNYYQQAYPLDYGTKMAKAFQANPMTK